jgi:peptidoglycan hydrolase FlgJ
MASTIQPIMPPSVGYAAGHGAARSPSAAGQSAREAGEEFEAMFIGQMIAHMFKGVGNDPLMGGGQAGELYRSMLQDEYGRTIARSGGIGIAESVTRELIKAQEGAQ